jgi:hypothetical protein
MGSDQWKVVLVLGPLIRKPASDHEPEMAG